MGKGVIKELRRRYPLSNVVAIDYDPGASEVNQLNRIKLMLASAERNLYRDNKVVNNNKTGDYAVNTRETSVNA